LTLRCLLSGGSDCRTVITATRWNASFGWAAGAMISTLEDLHRWARDVATGKLLTPATQKQRLRFIAVPGLRGVGYGLALRDVNGWIGHTGDTPGYETLSIYLPAQRATVVVLISTGGNLPNGGPINQLGQTITRIITPRHVYEFLASTP
jgi:D-alanyl-D-alanine carboxypeptidase